MTPLLIRRISLLMIAFALFIASGCGPTGPINEKVTEANWSKVETDMKLTDIEALLGPSSPGTRPASANQPEDANLTWKKWQRSSRDPEVIVGFDAKNEAEFVDKPKKK
jgi:hypothetical protein